MKRCCQLFPKEEAQTNQDGLKDLQLASGTKINLERNSAGLFRTRCIWKSRDILLKALISCRAFETVLLLPVLKAAKYEIQKP